MPLSKQDIDISFLGGQDTKTDPWRVSPNNFLMISNMVRNALGRLTKRDGFGALATLSSSYNYSYLTTFYGSLNAIGNNYSVYSPSTQKWYPHGNIQPLSLSVASIMRPTSVTSPVGQTQCDASVTSNGLVCTVTSAGASFSYFISDAASGQLLSGPGTLTGISTDVVTPGPSSSPGAPLGTPRVFLLGNYFVIVYTTGTSPSYSLKYIAVNTSTFAASSATTISTDYSPKPNVSWDAVSAGGKLYIAWNTAASGIKMVSLDTSLTLSSVVNPDPSHQASVMTVTADNTGTTPVIWVSYVDAFSTGNGYSFAVSDTLSSILAPTLIVSSGTTVIAMASAAANGLCTFFYSKVNAYSYDATVLSYFTRTNTVTLGGSVGSAVTLLRSVSLASKAFFQNGISGTIYMLVAYQSNPQSTYFMCDGSGNLIARFAYGSAGGYCYSGVPSVSIQNGTIYVPYLFAAIITPQTTLGPIVNNQFTSVSSILDTYGVNLAAFKFGADTLQIAEIGRNLNLTGGFLWAFDGNSPVEQNFHLYPDNVEAIGTYHSSPIASDSYSYQVIYQWPDNQGNIHRSGVSIPVNYKTPTPPGNFTGNRNSGSPIITSVSSVTGLTVGMTVTGTGIPANAYIIAVGTTTITLSASATSGTNTSTTLTPGAVTGIQLSGPYLRLTYKANVQISIFRYSTTLPIWYKLVTFQNVNDGSSDSWTYTDFLANVSIQGNEIIYTEGGEVENSGTSACKAITLFDDRVWVVPSESPNNLGFSQTVLETTPVEMSQGLTYYVNPNVGGQGNTGDCTCVAPMDDKLIIFKPSGLNYINGTGPDSTGNSSQYSQPIFISATVGSSNPKSIVLTPDGLMFQSENGIWLLDRGLRTSYIGAPVEAYNSYTVLSATCIPKTTQVRFMLSNGIILVFDYYTREWGTFNVSGVSSTLYQGLYTYIDDSGNTFQETPGVYLDGAVPVTWSFTTAWFNLAGIQGYQRAYWAFLLGKYLSPHTLNISVAYDYADSPSQVFTITADGATVEQWQLNFQYQSCESFQLTIEEQVVTPGAGLELSGINLTYGVRKAYPRGLAASKKAG